MFIISYDTISRVKYYLYNILNCSIIPYKQYNLIKFYLLENSFWMIFFKCSIAFLLPISVDNSIFSCAWLNFPRLSKGTWHELEFNKLTSN